MTENEDENTREPSVGHNTGAEQLRSIVERIERLEEEKKTVAEDIKQIYHEAKGQGFDAKQLRRVIAYRKRDPGEVQEEEAIFELYLQTLGMLSDE